MPAAGIGSSAVFLPGVFSVLVAQGQPGGLPVASAAYVSMYANCTDLFGEAAEAVRCIGYDGNYRWRPLRENWINRAVMSGDQSMVLRPLQTPTVLRLSGTTTQARNITFDTVNAWPGMCWDIGFDGVLGGVLGAFGISLAGLVNQQGGALSNIPLVAGNRYRLYFNGTGFST